MGYSIFSICTLLKVKVLNSKWYKSRPLLAKYIHKLLKIKVKIMQNGSFQSLLLLYNVKYNMSEHHNETI